MQATQECMADLAVNFMLGADCNVTRLPQEFPNLYHKQHAVFYLLIDKEVGLTTTVQSLSKVTCDSVVIVLFAEPPIGIKWGRD